MIFVKRAIIQDHVVNGACGHEDETRHPRCVCSLEKAKRPHEIRFEEFVKIVRASGEKGALLRRLAMQGGVDDGINAAHQGGGGGLSRVGVAKTAWYPFDGVVEGVEAVAIARWAVPTA